MKKILLIVCLITVSCGKDTAAPTVDMEQDVGPDVSSVLDQGTPDQPVDEDVNTNQDLAVADQSEDVAVDMGNGLDTVDVPEGTFQMGCDDALNCDADEAPAHDVFLSAFAIDRTEVSQIRYESCVAANVCTRPAVASYDPDQTPNLPVTNMTWDQAVEFCSWSGGSLPTEAQWEKACRGVGAFTYPWGEDAVSCALANVAGCGPQGMNQVVDVDTYTDVDSPFGTVHMAGNVWEWTADWHADDAYANHAAQDPTGPATGTFRVHRGGSSGNGGTLARCANRASAYASDTGGSGLGFRCVYDAN